MEFMAIVDAKARTQPACAVVGVYENGELGVAARQIDKQLDGMIGKLHGGGDFCRQARRYPDAAAACRSGGCARAADRSGHARRLRPQAVPQGPAIDAFRRSAKTGAGDAIVYLALEQVPELDMQYRARIVAEVFCAQAYKIPDLKTAAKPKAPRLSSRQCGGCRCARRRKRPPRVCASAPRIGSGTGLSRDLANLPPNVCTPDLSGTRALQALAKEFPSIKTKVLDESGIKALKMGAFLAVTQGSDQPPRLIVCEYRGGRKNSAPICLIGKGITFDSGGISLKDPPAMDEMKFDMSGGAAVLGTLRAVAELKLPHQSRGDRRRRARTCRAAAR